MSVYHVYTKTAHIPVYLVYKCQKCGEKVAAKGVYDISVSYNDRGTFRAKTVAKRAESAESDLELEAGVQARYFQRAVTEVHDDYEKITCACPKCGHGNLSRLGDRRKRDAIVLRIGLAIVAVFLIAVIISSISSGQKNIGSTILGGILFSFFGLGLLIMILNSILKAVEKEQMKKICQEAAPLICSDRDLLMAAAKKSTVFRDTDFSAIL